MTTAALEFGKGYRIDARPARQRVVAGPAVERVVAGPAVERVAQPIARQRVVTGAADEVLDAGNRGEARCLTRRQIDRHRRRGACTVAQRIEPTQQIGRDGLDTRKRAALDSGQHRAVEDNVERIGAGGSSDVEGIATQIANNGVGTIAHRVVDGIVAGTGIDHVIARAAGDGVIAVAAVDVVGTRIAAERVIARIAVESIVACTTTNDVVASRSAQHVVAAVAEQLVLASIAGESVGGVAALEQVAHNLGRSRGHRLGGTAVVDVGHHNAQLAVYL